MILGLNSKRKGITGIETAIILTAFVITASAFSFVILGKCGCRQGNRNCG